MFGKGLVKVIYAGSRARARTHGPSGPPTRTYVFLKPVCLFFSFLETCHPPIQLFQFQSNFLKFRKSHGHFEMIFRKNNIQVISGNAKVSQIDIY